MHGHTCAQRIIFNIESHAGTRFPDFNNRLGRSLKGLRMDHDA